MNLPQIPTLFQCLAWRDSAQFWILVLCVGLPVMFTFGLWLGSRGNPPE